MLCKVSFLGKQDVKSFNNKVTIVTLKGHLNMPIPIPNEVYNWVRKYLKNGKFTILNYSNKSCIISTTGVSKCSDKDTYDLVLGERIAESRAKIALYRFMELLCKKMYIFYKGIIDGKSDIMLTVANEHDCLYNSCLKYDMLHDREKQHLKDLMNGQSNVNSIN